MAVAAVPRETREQMTLSHLTQVELLAKQAYIRCKERVSLEGLVSVGTIGLIQAVDRYDASSGQKLKTLAEHRIRVAILDQSARRRSASSTSPKVPEEP